MDDVARFDDVLNAWLAGSADAEEVAELARRTAADSELALHVRRQHHLHLQLHALLGGPPAILIATRAQAVVLAQRPSSVQRIISGVRLSRVRRQYRRWMLWVNVAVAALLVIGLAWLPPLSRDPQVGPAASGSVRWSDGTTIDLSPGSRAEVLAPGSDAQMALHAGSLSATVAQQAEGRHFAIRTPHGLAVVIGTRFALEVDQRTRLMVHEGSVRLQAPDHSFRLVSAGGQASLPRPAPAPPNAPAASARVIDDHEGPMSWTNIAHIDGFNFSQATIHAFSGKRSLRMSFDGRTSTPRNTRYRYLVHPLLLQSDDQSLRLQVLVEAGSDPTTRFFVHMKDTARNNWILVKDRRLSSFSPGWNTLILPLSPTTAPGLAEVGDGIYDLLRISELAVGIGYGSGTVCVDEIEVLTASPQSTPASP